MIHLRARKRLGAFDWNVEFIAARGVTVLFGASGAGKTVTLEAIAGFLRPDAGRILVGDTLWYDGESGLCLPPQRRHCGYVFQNYALFPHLTLRQNLEYAVQHLPRLERRRRVNDLLERFKLTTAAERRPALLSGGQKQRCSIARALISGPRALLLDEPARGLDAPLRADLYEVIRQVQAEFAAPVLVVTHDLEECFALGEEMIVLHEGRVAQMGAPAVVLDRPATLEVARLIGRHNLIAAEIVHLDPQRDRSLLRTASGEIASRYYPGHLKGDRVTLCVRTDRVVAHPGPEPPAGGALPVRLERTVARPQGTRLEFTDGWAVESRDPRPPAAQNQEQWWLEVPGDAIHLLPRGESPC